MPIDTSLAKAPPRTSPRTTARGSTRAPVPEQKSQREIREEGLLGVGQALQGICVIAQQWADAGAIGMHVPRIAPELAKLADSYGFIATGVDLVIQVGPFGALLATGMPLVMQILANHKVIDATSIVGAGNVVPPEVLEAKMKADIMRQVAEAQREQAAAMRDAQEAQADYARIMATMTEQPSPNGAANDNPSMGV
jgi:hypothetical protein